jgi:hypothetical protein
MTTIQDGPRPADRDDLKVIVRTLNEITRRGREIPVRLVTTEES